MNRITIAFVGILTTFLLLPLLAVCQSDRIQLNQVGFYPHGPKTAIVTGATNATKFYVLSADQKKVVFTGVLSNEKRSQNSSLVTKKADFGSFRIPGDYILSIPGAGESYPFKISDSVLRPLSQSVLKGFYYQRSGEALPGAYAGKWARNGYHADTQVLIHPSAAGSSLAVKSISSRGGWYDAGDYNKYIVNSGISTATLLSAYEDFQDYFRNFRVNIPESGNAVPDILDEALYNVRWMLTMQDEQDGGVYHKLTNAEFDGMVMPGVTTAPRYVVQKSTAATLDFCAVAAQSARIFSEFKNQLPGLADSCLKAARKAWSWAITNPGLLYNQKRMNEKYLPAIQTGEYGDHFLDDEWFWGACEMAITTGEKQFASLVEKGLQKPVTLPGWDHVALLGYYSVLRYKNKMPGVAARMKDSILALASRYISGEQENAFATVMGGRSSDFIWGSNSVAANQGILMLQAFELTGDSVYLRVAVGNLDYLLGRNATNYCFVTGAGSRSPMFPHHRPSAADGIAQPVPGLLVGGPNPGQQDGCKYPSREPELSYVDEECSYASNEIAINWNAPMVYLVNAVEAIYGKR